MKKSHITYQELLEIVSWGIFNRNVKGTGCDTKDLDSHPVEGAMYGGIYVGSPGKDIFLMLPYLSDKQMKEISIKIKDLFPKIPSTNHVNVAACIRYVYGQFEKQGILRSRKDFKRMKKKRPDWLLSRKFLKLLYEELQKDNNFYGLSILCEMEGHRLGDEAVINKDKNKLKEMERTYNKSVKFAYKCESYKQMFTPYYWSAVYFSKFKEVEKSLYYYKLTFEQVDKYCPDTRDSYVYKIARAARYIRDKDKDNWNNFKKKYKRNANNKCVKKLFKELDMFIKRLKD